MVVGDLGGFVRIPHQRGGCRFYRVEILELFRLLRSQMGELRTLCLKRRRSRLSCSMNLGMVCG